MENKFDPIRFVRKYNYEIRSNLKISKLDKNNKNPEIKSNSKIWKHFIVVESFPFWEAKVFELFSFLANTLF